MRTPQTIVADEEADAPTEEMGASFESTTDPVSAGGVCVAKSGLSPDFSWITDPWDRGVLFSVKVDEVLHDIRSKFQRVQVKEGGVINAPSQQQAA